MSSIFILLSKTFHIFASYTTVVLNYYLWKYSVLLLFLSDKTTNFKDTRIIDTQNVYAIAWAVSVRIVVLGRTYLTNRR